MTDPTHTRVKHYRYRGLVVCFDPDTSSMTVARTPEGVPFQPLERRPKGLRYLAPLPPKLRKQIRAAQAEETNRQRKKRLKDQGVEVLETKPVYATPATATAVA